LLEPEAQVVYEPLSQIRKTIAKNSDKGVGV